MFIRVLGDFTGPLLPGVKAIRTAGSTADDRFFRSIDWVKSSVL